MALIVEVEGRPAAAVVAVPRPQFATFELVDLRVDYDYRRQGFATAMLYQLLGALQGREEVRAVYAEVRANTPPQELLARLGFELSGFDEPPGAATTTWSRRRRRSCGIWSW